MLHVELDVPVLNTVNINNVVDEDANRRIMGCPNTNPSPRSWRRRCFLYRSVSGVAMRSNRHHAPKL